MCLRLFSWYVTWDHDSCVIAQRCFCKLGQFEFDDRFVAADFGPQRGHLIYWLVQIVFLIVLL